MVSRLHQLTELLLWPEYLPVLNPVKDKRALSTPPVASRFVRLILIPASFSSTFTLLYRKPFSFLVPHYNSSRQIQHLISRRYKNLYLPSLMTLRPGENEYLTKVILRPMNSYLSPLLSEIAETLGLALF